MKTLIDKHFFDYMISNKLKTFKDFLRQFLWGHATVVSDIIAVFLFILLFPNTLEVQGMNLVFIIFELQHLTHL